MTLAVMAAGWTSPSVLAAFPDKPIKIIVYTEPGGPIDLTARKFADVAATITGATFVVENLPGSGGLVAINHVLDARADGYTLLACTKTNIAKAVATSRQEYLRGIDWIGLLLIDPECIIVRRDSALADWHDLVEDARRNPGQQIWVGPGSGTMDHVMAVRTWEAYEISARWVPFGGGSKALAALIGGQGIAYVGNPGDAMGNPDLRVSVLSRNERMPQLPDTPVFTELGHPELAGQFMWRGFALRGGCPGTVRAWYDQLFRAVTAHPTWRAFWERDGIEVVYRDPAEFSRIVRDSEQEFSLYLGRLNLVAREGNLVVRVLSSVWALAAAAAGIVTAAIHLTWRGRSASIGYRLIPLAITAVCLLLFAQTFRFPAEEHGMGAAGIPRLWILLTVACAVLVLVGMFCKSAKYEIRSPRPDAQTKVTPNDQPVVSPRHRPDLVWKLVGITCAQWFAVRMVGYYVAACAGSVAVLYLLGVRRWRVIAAVSLGWLAFAYVVFVRFLHVDVPIGNWFP